MATVVPAILEQEWPAIQKKAKQIKKYTDFIQLDVMDGNFVPNTTFNDTEKLATLDLTMELHLMIERPELAIAQWALPNVSRMIVHYEAVGNVPNVVKHIRSAGKEAALAINPETTVHSIEEYLDDLDMVLVMGVHPGFSGQTFITDAYEKIRELKRARPDLLVEVDGGVNGYVARKIVEAGADVLAAASFIWQSDDIGQTIADLEAL